MAIGVSDGGGARSGWLRIADVIVGFVIVDVCSTKLVPVDMRSGEVGLRHPPPLADTALFWSGTTSVQSWFELGGGKREEERSGGGGVVAHPEACPQSSISRV